ncbi:MAG: NAD+ synthase [Gammaproteobacteria bacterium]
MTLKIALAQINLTVGAITANRDKIIATALRARERLGAEVCVFPELSITAYPPEDLLLRRDFIAAAAQAVHDIAAQTRGICVVLGFPEQSGGKLYNSAAVLNDGAIRTIYRKNALPNYGVFDEKRYFTAGTGPCVFTYKDMPLGITICEDVWQPGIVETTCRAGAKIIININASPFHADKIYEREAVVRERIQATGMPVVYVNQIGGQDELVFDGASFVMDGKGDVVFRAEEFSEQLSVVEFGGGHPQPGVIAPHYMQVASDYRALVLGIRDYVNKNGFKGALLGLSGGVDSALTLALAVDALGAEQVEAVLMPSRYTQQMSLDDAELEAQALGIRYHTIPIEPAVQAFNTLLAEVFAGSAKDVTEENIQARCRGIILMAISNKQGRLLLTTGNKSEMSVGYATLYGDMAGGFAPLKDVPKMLVYRLSQYRNAISPVIPERVLVRPPSAELAPDQKDEDSLPPYAQLDPILERYVEQDQSAEEIIAAGFSEEHVRRAINLVDKSEYKRRQSPPGIRITPRAFGRDRRYPITSGYRGAK